MESRGEEAKMPMAAVRTPMTSSKVKGPLLAEDKAEDVKAP